MHYAGIDTGEKLLSRIDALLHRWLSVSLRGVAVHLRSVEHRIAATEEQPGTAYGVFFAVLRFGCAVAKLPKDHERGTLSTANLCAAFLPLLVRGPFAAFVAFRLCCSPQAQRIDSAIRFLAHYVDWAEGKLA